MIPVPHKVIVLGLLFPLLPLDVAAMPLPSNETLVEYTPEPDAPPCRGVRITENLIATSPLCARKVREDSGDELIEMYTLTGEPIGVVAEQPGSLSEKSMLLQVTLDTEGVNPSHYPMLYDAPPAPEQAFAYNVDKNNQLFQQPVKLASGATRSESVFTVSSELQLPAGTPIFDTKGQLVCLSDGSNQCYTVSKSLVERAIRGRGLNDDYDYDDEGLSTAAQIGIVAGVGVAAIAIPTTLFYLVTWLKAHSAGMSAGVYWPGILSLQYCSHCTVNTAMPAIVGTIVCPLTGMLSCLVGYPISTSMAAFNWINSYSNPSESVPIISHQPTHAPPQY